ncbi:MAG: mechanosensitive ion channel family protein [Hasllibacter sp.]
MDDMPFMEIGDARVWWDLALNTLSTFMVPGWKLWQLLIVIGLIVGSYLIARLAEPRIRRLVAGRGWSKLRLRLLAIVLRRLWLIVFVLASYAAWLILQEVTWPSRSYLVGLAARIGLAWMIISFVARLIVNKVLRRWITWGATAWVTVYYLGIEAETRDALDAAALETGDFRISLLDLILAATIIAILFFAAAFVSRSAGERIRRNEDISPSMQVLTVKLLQIFLYAGAFFFGLRAVGVDLTGLAVLSGAIGVGLGFGLQKVVSNLISGLIILMDKSIKPGDVISLGETFGWINSLGARYVSITTRDGKEYLIPNEDLITNQVVNWSHSNDFVRLDIYFGTAYGDDPHLVRRVAIEAAMGVSRVLQDRPPVCHIVGFGDSSVDYILRFWITDPTGGLTNIRGNVYLALWDAFQEHGVSIPFPQREVKVLEGSRLSTVEDRPARAAE